MLLAEHPDHRNDRSLMSGYRFSCKLRASVYRPAGGAGLCAGRRLRLGGKRLILSLLQQMPITSARLRYAIALE